ncbi:MAG: hypothetical protein FJX34_02905 [Alphaproteobacteria bacterium]|nr:hypothetical protein [Alphaproteobacteria bacterium]
MLKILTRVYLILLAACGSLTANKEEFKTYSLISVKIIYDGEEKKNEACKISLRDTEFNNVKFRHEKNSEFFLVESKPGKITLNYMRCGLILKINSVNLNDWGFFAHPDFVNYLGHVTIIYQPDSNENLEIKITDKIDEASHFLSKNHPELKNIPLGKSLLVDVAKVKPSDKPKPYSATTPTPPSPPANPVATTTETPNPYYTPPTPSATVPYRNPYKN